MIKEIDINPPAELEHLFEEAKVKAPFFKPLLKKERVKNENTFFKGIIVVIGEFLTGIFLLWFGIYNAGSYYATATRFSGALSDVFYVYQVGTLCMIVGLILWYDAIRRVFNR